jgi:hypothetical protein
VGTEITLITIYDRLAAVDNKLDSHIARVDERLDHGSRQIADHEARLRTVEAALPPGLEGRISALERFRWGAAGAAALAGALSGGGLATVLVFALSHGH